MSRAAVQAKKEQKKLEKAWLELEAWAEKMEHDAFSDAMLYKCENCGLEQVSRNKIMVVDYNGMVLRTPELSPCVLCGHHIATFVEDLTR